MSFPSFRQWADTHCDDGDSYYKSRAEAFADYINELAKVWAEEESGDFLDVEQFADWLYESRDEDFKYPDYAEWCEDEYEGELGDYADRLYEERRDMEMGIG